MNSLMKGFGDWERCAEISWFEEPLPLAANSIVQASRDGFGVL